MPLGTALLTTATLSPFISGRSPSEPQFSFPSEEGCANAMQSGILLPTSAQAGAARRTLFLWEMMGGKSLEFSLLCLNPSGKRPRHNTVCTPMQTAAEGCNFLIFTAALHVSFGECSPAAGNSVFSNIHWHKTMHSTFKAQSHKKKKMY